MEPVGACVETRGGGVERCRGRATRELHTKGMEESNRCLTVGVVVVGRNGTSGLGLEAVVVDDRRFEIGGT